MPYNRPIAFGAPVLLKYNVIVCHNDNPEASRKGHYSIYKASKGGREMCDILYSHTKKVKVEKFWSSNDVIYSYLSDPKLEILRIN